MIYTEATSNSNKNLLWYVLGDPTKVGTPIIRRFLKYNEVQRSSVYIRKNKALSIIFCIAFFLSFTIFFSKFSLAQNKDDEQKIWQNNRPNDRQNNQISSSLKKDSNQVLKDLILNGEQQNSEDSYQNFQPQNSQLNNSQIAQNLQQTADSPAFEKAYPKALIDFYKPNFNPSQTEQQNQANSGNLKENSNLQNNWQIQNSSPNSPNSKTTQKTAQEDAFSKYSSYLYNQELRFNNNRQNQNLSDFRDIDGRIISRYSDKKLSIYDPKTPTPSRLFSADLSLPKQFFSTNNLAKKTGSFYRAYGEITFIQGTITDSFGVPIQNAIVEIWQTNSAGKYHSLLEPYSEFIDPFFNMSGRAITDNLGNYYFITIMPGSFGGRTPHINFNIYHQHFGKLETEMYFEDHPLNKIDSQYLSYPEKDRKLLTAYGSNTNILNPRSIKIFTFNIVMRGIHQYKKF